MAINHGLKISEITRSWWDLRVADTLSSCCSSWSSTHSMMEYDTEYDTWKPKLAIMFTDMPILQVDLPQEEITEEFLRGLAVAVKIHLNAHS